MDIDINDIILWFVNPPRESWGLWGPPPIRAGQNPRINESTGKAQIASGKHTKSY